MKMNRKGVTWAIAGLALAGALVGGAGIAVAATGTPQPSPSSTSLVDPPYGHMGGMGGRRGIWRGRSVRTPPWLRPRTTWA